MKQYFFFTGIVFLAVIGCIFFIEKTDALHLKQLDITVVVQE